MNSFSAPLHTEHCLRMWHHAYQKLSAQKQSNVVRAKKLFLRSLRLCVVAQSALQEPSRSAAAWRMPAEQYMRAQSDVFVAAIQAILSCPAQDEVALAEALFTFENGYHTSIRNAMRPHVHAFCNADQTGEQENEQLTRAHIHDVLGGEFTVNAFLLSESTPIASWALHDDDIDADFVIGEYPWTQWRQCVEEYGFSRVDIQTSSHASLLHRQTQELLRSSKTLRKVFNIPTTMIGLEGAVLELGTDPINAVGQQHMGSYNPTKHTLSHMVVDIGLTFIHEWTHGLESVLKTRAPHDPHRQALRTWKQGLRHLPQDEDSAQRVRDFLWGDSDVSLQGHWLDMRFQEKIQEIIEEHTGIGIDAHDPHAVEVMIDEALHAFVKPHKFHEKIHALTQVVAQWDSPSAPSAHSSATKLLHSYETYCMHVLKASQKLRRQVSAWRVAAEYADHSENQNYWSKPSEMLARGMESLFLDLIHHNEPGEELVCFPQGKEREAFRNLTEIFFAALAAPPPRRTPTRVGRL